EQGLHTARRGGTIVQVGTLPGSVTLALNLVMARELALVGSFRFANAFQTSITLVAQGRIDVRPLITAVYPLADLPVAIEAAIHDRRNIKVQIAP
ncbi:MAG: L-idonate 5-dehydrogenase, partial [Rhodobacterales bacterium]